MYHSTIPVPRPTLTVTKIRSMLEEALSTRRALDARIDRLSAMLDPWDLPDELKGDGIGPTADQIDQAERMNEHGRDE